MSAFPLLAGALIASAVLAAILAAPPVYAQRAQAAAALRQAQQTIPESAGVDLQHGLDVVMGRAECSGEGQCAPCYQCHQIQGQGNVSTAFPRIAGQSYRYLYTSLQDFAAGRRKSGTMTPIARALSRKSMQDVAAFYSAQEVSFPTMAIVAAQKSTTTQPVLAAGGKMAAVGIPERGVQGCVNCHGPQGAGLPPTYPYLAGQYADYLESQLKAWQSGDRGDDTRSLGVMQEIAKRLTPGQMHAVSQYFAAIQPPRILREENYTGPLELGVPLGPELRRRGGGEGARGGAVSGRGQQPSRKQPATPNELAVPPQKIP